MEAWRWIAGGDRGGESDKECAAKEGKMHRDLARGQPSNLACPALLAGCCPLRVLYDEPLQESKDTLRVQPGRSASLGQYRAD